jgi:hypothetical protein
MSAANCVGREQLFAMAHEMLSGREVKRVKAHVEACAGCRQALEGYRRLDTILDEWKPAAEASPWFDARLRAAVASVEPARPSRGFFGLAWNHWIAAPALAALLVASSLIALRYARLHSGRPEAARAPAAPLTAVTPAPSQAAAQELKMYQNLPVLEDYDMLAGFDVISELPKGKDNAVD